MNKQQFYEACAEILHVPFVYKEFPKRRGRWFPREPGNGSFADKALIRWFSSDCIRIDTELVSHTFERPEDALEFLRGITKS